MDVAEATAGSRDYDVLAVGAGVTMGTERDREREPERQKRWDALLKRPDLDYSDLFSETTGKLPGLAVWQIENFYPVEIDDCELRKLAFFSQNVKKSHLKKLVYLN